MCVESNLKFKQFNLITTIRQINNSERVTPLCLNGFYWCLICEIDQMAFLVVFWLI